MMSKQNKHSIKLKPIFVELLPEFKNIKNNEIWISLKYRTINLRCPCGCGSLTVLTIHPSRWHVLFDGKSISLDGPTGGSVWSVSGCGSHYFIRENTVIWQDKIDQVLQPKYAEAERARMLESMPVSDNQIIDTRSRKIWNTTKKKIMQIYKYFRKN